MYDRNATLVGAWIDAVNNKDRSRFASLVTEDVELVMHRRAYRGIAEALTWIDRPLENLDLEVEPRRFVVGDDWVLCVATLRLRWPGSGEIGDESDGVAVWWLDDGRISRWQPFDKQSDALAAVGLSA